MSIIEPKTGPSIDSVLFATDFSAASAAAFSYAAAIAERYKSKLYVAHVINLESFELLGPEPARSALEQAHQEADRKMTQLLDPLSLPRDRFQVVVAEGSIPEALMEIIQRHHIDLAVVGTHGRRAFKKMLMGSVAEEVFRMAPCPVLTIGPKNAPADGNAPIRHILYPVEFAPDTSKASQYAVSLADRYAARLTVMNVLEDMPPSESQSEQFTAPFKHWITDHVPEGTDLRKRVVFQRGFGPAVDAILDFAAKGDVDMIVLSVPSIDPVIASHLPNADTTNELVRRAPCPVLAVR